MKAALLNTNPETVLNEKLEVGYYSLDALAKLKNLSVPDLFLVYTVEHNVSLDNKVFYNIAPVTVH